MRSKKLIDMKYEVLIEDSFYHIYNCGNNKENIFIDEQNYIYFLQLAKKHLAKTSDIVAYCLLKKSLSFFNKNERNDSFKKNFSIIFKLI